MVRKHQMLRGGSKKRLVASDAATDAADAAAAAAAAAAPPKLETETERYLRFHHFAAARKLALASRDLEVADARIEDLFDLAQQGDVPCADAPTHAHPRAPARTHAHPLAPTYLAPCLCTSPALLHRYASAPPHLRAAAPLQVRAMARVSAGAAALAARRRGGGG